VQNEKNQRNSETRPTAKRKGSAYDHPWRLQRSPPRRKSSEEKTMKRTIRVGLGKGRGKGYRNILPGHDRRVHTESGHGMKQPQLKVLPNYRAAVQAGNERYKIRERMMAKDPFKADLADRTGNKYQKFKVVWQRKSNTDDDWPFRVDEPYNWNADAIQIIEDVPIVKVTSAEFDRMATTLDPIPQNVMQMAGYEPGSAKNMVFIINDGQRRLAIDAEGYDYPRYKSYIVPVTKTWGKE
jgi:hypothetical protein